MTNSPEIVLIEVTDSGDEITTYPKILNMLECCFIHENGQQCTQKAKFWVGKNEVDSYTHTCADHVQDLKQDGDRIYNLFSNQEVNYG